jgi:RNA polymerase sigma factor (sigma-70 family)
MGQHRLPPDEGPPDERELERLYSGEDEDAARTALVELRCLHDGSLRRQALHQSGGDEELAREALADTDLKLWQSRQRFNADYANRAGTQARSRWRIWAGRLLRNNTIDRLRRLGVEWGIPQPGSASASPEPPPVRHRGHREDETAEGISLVSPEFELLRAERKASVLDCLRRLKQAQKAFFDVLVIYYWGGKKQQEIAHLLGVVVSTVNKRLEAGRIAMHDCLSRNHPEVIDEI